MTQYPQQPGYGMAPQHPGSMLKPHRGTVILVLGILGLVVCGICGIVAWVMGNADLREMDSGLMDPAGRGTTQAGKILGMISVGLMALGLVLWLIMMVVGLSAAAAGAAGSGP